MTEIRDAIDCMIREVLIELLESHGYRHVMGGSRHRVFFTTMADDHFSFRVQADSLILYIRTETREHGTWEWPTIYYLADPSFPDNLIERLESI